MNPRDLIQEEIARLSDQQVKELYELVRELARAKQTGQKPGFMSRLRRIQIEAPEDFSENLDLYTLERRVPTRIFVDTLFVIAVINQRDHYHSQAVELSEGMEGAPLLVTDAVLLEIGNALARNFKREAVAVIDDFLQSKEVEIVHLTPELFDKAFMLYATHADKAWGLVGCISFVVMREAGATEALTFDRHFSQAGFRCLMREEQV